MEDLPKKNTLKMRRGTENFAPRITNLKIILKKDHCFRIQIIKNWSFPPLCSCTKQVDFEFL